MKNECVADRFGKHIHTVLRTIMEEQTRDKAHLTTLLDRIFAQYGSHETLTSEQIAGMLIDQSVHHEA